MGRVTGRQRSTITKQPRPVPMLMPWEVRYQHRIEEFFTAPQDVSSSFQDTTNSLSCESADETVSQKDSETVAMNSFVIHETNSSKDYSGLEVMEERQDQLIENSERETCGSSIISDDVTVKSPSKTEVSVQPAELPNSARKQEAAGSGGPTLGPLMSLQQSPVQLEVPFNPHVKQSTVVLKTIKYATNYNLDHFFNYAFTSGKVSLKQRLMSK